MEKTKYFLKTPILRNLETQPGGEIAVENVQDYKVGPRNETLNVGIATTIIYFISFIWIYFSAAANCDKKGVFKNFPPKWYSKPFNQCNGLIGHKTLKDSFTMSYMFLYFFRYLSTVLITLTCIMVAIILFQQNFAVTEEGMGRVFYVTGTFVLATMMVALLLFGPKEHTYFHIGIALAIVLAGTTLALGSTELYKQTYEEEKFKDMEIISWILFALTICILFSIFWFHKTKKYRPIADNMIATFEILHWVTFGIFIFILSLKPPLLVNNFCAISV